MAMKKTKGNEPRKNILTASLPAGKGASPFFDGPAILAMYSPLRSPARFCDPAWKRIGGGCHLNRKIDDLITGAGFQIVELRTNYLPGPRPMTYTYHGFAHPL